MNDIVEHATPKEKLALSRAALLAAMGIVEARTVEGATLVQSLPPPASPLRSRVQASWLGRWWRRHPARSAIDLLEPGLERLAHRKPWQLVASAAGVGSLVVLLKPWRLLSVGAVVTLIFKSADIAGALSSFMQAKGAGEPLQGDAIRRTATGTLNFPARPVPSSPMPASGPTRH